MINALTDALVFQVVFGSPGMVVWFGINVGVGIAVVTLARLFGWRWVQVREDDV